MALSTNWGPYLGVHIEAPDVLKLLGPLGIEVASTFKIWDCRPRGVHGQKVVVLRIRIPR